VQRDASTAVSALETELVDDQSIGQTSGAAPAMRQALFVLPSRRGDGFRVSVRGHLLELADPNSRHGLAPTPDDLLIASIASDLAWCARRFLRAQGLPDDASISAEWRTLENPPRPADICVTVSVHETVKSVTAALLAALAERVAARSVNEPLRFQLRCMS
jgi:putative redox protein